MLKIPKIIVKTKEKNIPETEKIINLSDKHITNIFHMSDIHIKRINEHENNIEFNDIVNKVTEKIISFTNEGVHNVIVMVGDILDSRIVSLYSLQNLYLLLKTLSSLAPIIIIPGNHDVNVTDAEDYDILKFMCNIINGNNNIYYLRKTGLYKYGQMIFSHSSVFEEKIIDPSTIPNKYIKTFLFHGFVMAENVNMSYLAMNKHVKVEQLQGYNLLLLGDIHQYIELKTPYKDMKGAYCSSLTQTKFDESVDIHGFICWNVSNKDAIKSTYIQIDNNYILYNLYLKDNKLSDVDMQKINKLNNKKIKLKIIHDKTGKQYIETIKKMISNNNKILFERTHEEITIKDDNSNIYSIEDYCGRDNIFKLIIESIKKDIPNITEKQTANLKTIHDEIYLRCFGNENEIKSKKTHLNILSLTFENMFCFKSRNHIDFTKYKGVTGINGKNYTGKTSICEIIIYILFDTLSKIKRFTLDDILNHESTNFYGEMVITVNEKQYKIVKSYNKLTQKERRDVILYEFDEETKKYKNTNSGNTNDVCAQINKILNISYNDFMLSSMISQNLNVNILDQKNSDRKNTIYEFSKMDIYDKLCDEMKCILKVYNKKLEDNIYNKKICDQKLKNLELITEEFINMNIQKKNSIKDELDVLREEIFINKYCKEKIPKLKKEINDKNKMKQELIQKNKNMIVLVEKYNIQIENITLCEKVNMKHILLEKILSQYCGLQKKNDILNHIIKKDDMNEAIYKIISTSKDINEIVSEIDEIYKDENIKDVEYKKAIDRLYVDIDKNKLIITELEKTIGELIDEIKENDGKDNVVMIQKHNEKENEYENIIKQIDNDASKLKDKNENEKLIKEYDDAINILKRQCLYFEKYIHLVGINGLPFELMTKLSKKLEIYCNSFLKKFCSITIMLDFNTEVTSNGNVLGTFNIRKKNDESDKKELLVETSSGYEKTAITIALKLALSTFFNLRINILILDEPFKDADDVNMERISDMMDFLQKKIDDIIIISHDNKIKDLYIRQLVTRKENDVSKVITND